MLSWQQMKGLSNTYCTCSNKRSGYYDVMNVNLRVVNSSKEMQQTSISSEELQTY